MERHPEKGCLFSLPREPSLFVGTNCFRPPMYLNQDVKDERMDQDHN